MQCTECGTASYSDSALWCTKCGARLPLRRPRVELVARLPPHLERSGPSDPRSGEILAEGEFVPEGTYDRPGQEFPHRLLSANCEISLPVAQVFDPDQGAQPREQLREFLIVNQAEVVLQSCVACGGPLAPKSGSEAILVAHLNAPGGFLFCHACGDNIMSHVSSERGAAWYSWDWAFSLR